jgi:hypothetical protein
VDKLFEVRYNSKSKETFTLGFYDDYEDAYARMERSILIQQPLMHDFNCYWMIIEINISNPEYITSQFNIFRELNDEPHTRPSMIYQRLKREQREGR